MNELSIERNKSGSARSSCSATKAEKSILWELAVIVSISPSLELGGSSKDHAMTVFTSHVTLVVKDSYTTSVDLSGA
jgi:hypothetical protein